MRIEFMIAQQWREKHGYVGKGGICILYDDVVTAWLADLPPPDQWTPECLAVDEQGQSWRASGGNENEGAKRWEAYGSSRWMPGR